MIQSISLKCIENNTISIKFFHEMVSVIIVSELDYICFWETTL